jgi:hypothetical protein
MCNVVVKAEEKKGVIQFYVRESCGCCLVEFWMVGHGVPDDAMSCNDGRGRRGGEVVIVFVVAGLRVSGMVSTVASWLMVAVVEIHLIVMVDCR